MNNHTQAKQERKTVTLIFLGDHDHPEAEMVKVTPTTAETIRKMEKMDERQRKEMYRVIHAIKNGLFPYTAAEIETWTLEQRRAVIESLPEVAS